ncbi:MAG: PAC2 family protein [archaeon]
MEIKLKKKPQKPLIIQGLPSLGLVGGIAAEFLIDHLNAEQIGCLYSEKLPPVASIHKGQVLDTFGIFYNEKSNIIIIRPLSLASGIEWELADSIANLSEILKAREVISLEGINAGQGVSEPQAFFFTADKGKSKKLQNLGLTEIREGLVFGVSASLLSKQPDSTFIFTETHSDLPDSRSAAKMIEVLDKYLGLDIDYKPLLEKAEMFEKKLKTIMQAGQTAPDKAKSTSYLG